MEILPGSVGARVHVKPKRYERIEELRCIGDSFDGAHWLVVSLRVNSFSGRVAWMVAQFPIVAAYCGIWIGAAAPGKLGLFHCRVQEANPIHSLRSCPQAIVGVAASARWARRAPRFQSSRADLVWDSVWDECCHS